MPFTHLQVHSHLTLLGGTASIDALVARAVAGGLTHLALTDRDALYGAVAFDRACRGAGITPITGLVATVAAPAVRLAPGHGPGRLVLLATGPEGYRSLCRLSSSLQAVPEREERLARGLDWETLEENAQGLICLSGGRLGWIERLFRAGDPAAAYRYARRLVDIYPASAYLSLEIHRPEDRACAEQLSRLGHKVGLPPVAVQPVYCLDPGDAPRLRLLAAIDRNVPLDRVPGSALPAGGDPDVDVHWLAPEEIANRFGDLPEAIANVAEVAGRCGDPVLPGGSPIWPDLRFPVGTSADQALRAAAEAGLEARYPPEAGAPAGFASLPQAGEVQEGGPISPLGGAKPPSPTRGRGLGGEGGIHARLHSELEAIADHGYAPLFLVVSDIARFARSAGIPINTRGSVANSLVAYCTGITHVDPIEHDLLFERFLNPSRADLPDIDLDFCSRRRDEVLEYVRRTYGAERVALVSTMSTLQPRGAVRETAKAYGLDGARTGHLVSLLPRRWHPDPRRRDRRTVDDVLATLDDPREREILTAAYELVGQPHHLSVHPGGLVITPGPLTGVLPLQWAPKGFLITQFDHHDVEAIGLPKLDLLGIRALSVLAGAERLVRAHHEPSFRVDAIPFDDPATADLLARAETVGVFQCESTGARRTLRQLRARTVRDLAVANAFFKPGPATGGMARAFVRRYRGEERVEFLHPALAPILGPTQGVLLFQEQVLRVAREIAGLTWVQADQLRRGMGHFGHEQMAEIEAQFVAGCQVSPPGGPGMTRAQAHTLWAQVHAFAGYGFNQGHATSYATVSYRSAYLKAHWPAAFFAARLAEWGGFHHPAVYLAEAVRLGLAARPPHVNHSGRRFTLGWEGEQAVLWMGLGQVRDLRDTTIRAILRARQAGAFRDVRDLLRRVPMQSKEVTHLIQCGALDGLGEGRAALLAEAGEIDRAGSALQMTFGFARQPVPAETAAQRLAWERHLLGWSVSIHPLAVVADALPAGCLPLRALPGATGRHVVTAGARLPGWTGGQGFYLGDGDTYVVALPPTGGGAPRPWEPVVVRGRWVVDEWGAGSLQTDAVDRVITSMKGNR